VLQQPKNTTAAPSGLAHTLSWPPTSHTVKLMFLYSTVSTLKPVGGQEGALRGQTHRERRGNNTAGGAKPVNRALGLTNGGDGGHDLAQLQLVQDGGLAGRVQPHLQREKGGRSEQGLPPLQPPPRRPPPPLRTHHEDTHLLLSDQAREQLADCETHGCCLAPPELLNAWIRGSSRERL
jgi:hypothetical protein